MLGQAQRRLVSLAIILILVAGGLASLVYPVPVEENGPVYSNTNFSGNELNVWVGYAPPGYYTTTQIESGNDVTVVITILLGTASTEIFRSSFPAGTVEVSKVSVGNGGTVFLSVESRGGVFTQLSVYARIFRYITTYPYSWAGLVVLGLAGLFMLATEFGNTSFGKAARMILPVNKLGF